MITARNTDDHIPKIAGELKLLAHQVSSTVSLLDQGSTVPFIARYRKEATSSLDEVAITSIRDRMTQLRDLAERMGVVLSSLEERGLLTEELQQRVQNAETRTVLEDVYLPYRPKRRTRATIAREKGLEHLAMSLWDQGNLDVMAEAASYIDPTKEVHSVEEVLQGARDIIAEWISEDADARAKIRSLFESKGMLVSRLSKGKAQDESKYLDYFDWEESISTAPSHRVLAMMRGERESYLTLHISPPEEETLAILEGHFVTGSEEPSNQVSTAAHDSYKRLLGPSLETEVRVAVKARADGTAILVFAENLRQLLLAPPLGQRRVMAIDPGIRTGCKVVVLDPLGNLLEGATIYPRLGEKQEKEAAQIITELCRKNQIEVIVVGNGTGGRETESFLRKLTLDQAVQIVMVSESGASIYSASVAAREEFPDQDLTVRGAISIGRRVMDPLAELIKIDPGSIGVGQYQHDVDQSLLKQKLDDVVVSCVNKVGVDVNTASKQLLGYVSGLGPNLAKAIFQHRDKHGPFKSREGLLKVPRLGPKAFEQAAGFLRIHDSQNPLDASAVHPERYSLVLAMAQDNHCSVGDLMADESIRSCIDLKQYVKDDVGLLTLQDILEELARPGRDPRERFKPFSFAEGVERIEDLQLEMQLPGLVTNITAFGAFVDIGVHQDGLVHISQLADRFVKNPTEVVKVNQQVTVTVLEIDVDRKRISLSMKSRPGPENSRTLSDSTPG